MTKKQINKAYSKYPKETLKYVNYETGDCEISPNSLNIEIDSEIYFLDSVNIWRPKSLSFPCLDFQAGDTRCATQCNNCKPYTEAEIKELEDLHEQQIETYKNK